MAKIVTPSTVQWSDGSNFQGVLLLLFVTPELGSGNYPSLRPRLSVQSPRRPEALPQRIFIPIIDGIVVDNHVFKKNQLSPPNVKLYDFWLDSEANTIGVGASLFEVTTDEHSLTPPTLTAPTAESSLPAISYSVDGVTLSFSGVSHDFENLGGTKDGSNTTFTISRAPVNFMLLFWRNNTLVEGVDFSRSGTTITMLTFAPASGDALYALIV